MKSTMLGLLALGLLTQAAQAFTVGDYMIIATGSEGGDNGIGKTLDLSNSELGAIGVNSSASTSWGPATHRPSHPGPGGLPPGPRSEATSPSLIRGFVTITDSTGGVVTASNSDVHSGGLDVLGQRGIDCAQSFAGCTSDGSQISSNNRFNSSTPLPFSPRWRKTMMSMENRTLALACGPGLAELDFWSVNAGSAGVTSVTSWTADLNGSGVRPPSPRRSRSVRDCISWTSMRGVSSS